MKPAKLLSICLGLCLFFSNSLYAKAQIMRFNNPNSQFITKNKSYIPVIDFFNEQGELISSAKVAKYYKKIKWLSDQKDIAFNSDNYTFEVKTFDKPFYIQAKLGKMTTQKLYFHPLIFKKGSKVLVVTGQSGDIKTIKDKKGGFVSLFSLKKRDLKSPAWKSLQKGTIIFIKGCSPSAWFYNGKVSRKGRYLKFTKLAFDKFIPDHESISKFQCLNEDSKEHLYTTNAKIKALKKEAERKRIAAYNKRRNDFEKNRKCKFVDEVPIIELSESIHEICVFLRDDEETKMVIPEGMQYLGKPEFNENQLEFISSYQYVKMCANNSHCSSLGKEYSCDYSQNICVPNKEVPFNQNMRTYSVLNPYPENRPRSEFIDYHATAKFKLYDAESSRTHHLVLRFVYGSKHKTDLLQFKRFLDSDNLNNQNQFSENLNCLSVSNSWKCAGQSLASEMLERFRPGNAPNMRCTSDKPVHSYVDNLYFKWKSTCRFGNHLFISLEVVNYSFDTYRFSDHDIVISPLKDGKENEAEAGLNPTLQTEDSISINYLQKANFVIEMYMDQNQTLGIKKNVGFQVMINGKAKSSVTPISVKGLVP